MSKLHLATEGPCAGHLCDNCKICQRGRCCRHDNPHYQLPKMGEWDGPIYGELGQLKSDGVRIECHCCGKWYVSIGMHAWYAHDLTSDEYRSIFGLAYNRSLLGEQARQAQSKVSKRLAQSPHIAAILKFGRDKRDEMGTPEQRRAWLDRAFDRLENISKMGPKSNIGTITNYLAANGLPGPNTRLTWSQVHEIRALNQQGHSINSLSRIYGVDRKTIRGVVKGKSWIEHDVNVRDGNVA